MTRTNHTNRAGKALFLSDLVALSHRFLPETRPLKGSPAKFTPREQLWRTTKLRPEIVAVFDALADRHPVGDHRGGFEPLAACSGHPSVPPRGGQLMFDALAKTDPNEVAPAAGVLLCMCPRCGEAYIAGRKDQKFCSRTCQKNASRGSRQIAESPEERRRQETRKGRIEGLSHAFYETRPAYRAEYLEKLIKEARERVELRGLVTRRPTLRSWARDKGTGRLHIAHVLDHYCQAVYGLRCFVVVNPETELPQADTLAFPSEYFGPDAPPVYEDGSLKVRPCPWATRKEPQSASTSIKGNLLGDSLRGYVRMDAGEFIEQIKAMRAARAQGLRKPTRMRLTYAEEIGMDQNINAPL